MTTHLSDAGEVVDCYLPTDRATGRPRGFAFVEFSSDQEAEEAIRLFDGKELDGRELRINPAEERRKREPRGFRPPPSGDGDDRPFFGGGRGGGGGGNKNKGSRRGLRGRKRSL